MIKLDVILTAVVSAGALWVVGTAVRGWYLESSSELDTRLRTLELSDVKKSENFIEILRRLERIENKLDQKRL